MLLINSCVEMAAEHGQTCDNSVRHQSDSLLIYYNSEEKSAALSYLPNNLQTTTITHGYLMKDTICASDKIGLMQGEEQTVLNALKPGLEQCGSQAGHQGQASVA